MKNDVMPSIVQMDADELKNLLTEVKETVATGYQMPEEPKRLFTVADLWSIRSKAKSASNLMRR